MFEVKNKGFFKEVSHRQFGQQHLGINPGGPQDLFSFKCGHILLDTGDILTLEITQPPVLKLSEDVHLCITGAPAPCKINDTPIDHATVYKACSGDLLTFLQAPYGFRSYLSLKKIDGKDLCGRARGDYSEFNGWAHSSGRIRVVEGPEYDYLENPDDFFGNSWRITTKMDDSGIRIERPEVYLNLKSNLSMISEAVADGTIQLTPSGPIILLRHRQTTGGYPRVFNVISADIDMLAQHRPGTLVRFKLVNFQEALKALSLQNEILQQLKSSY